MARIIKYYAENGVTVIEEGNDTIVLRPTFSYNEVSDVVTIINLDNQPQDWSAESSVFRKKDGSLIGSTKDDIIKYLSDNTVFSKTVFPKSEFSSLIADMFEGRALEDGGTFEAKECLIDNLQDLL